MKRISFPFEVKRGSVTVRIYSTPSHKCRSFTLSYYQDGVRKRPTFPDFESAKTEAEIVASRLSSTSADILTLSSADRAVYLRARQLLDPLGLPLETAAAQLADAVNRLGDIPLSHAVDFYLKRHPTKMEPKTVQEVATEFLEAKKSDGLSERYLEWLGYSMRKFAASFRCNIGAVTSSDMDNWLRKLGLSPRSRNNIRNAVLTLFGFAKSRRYLPKDNDEIESVPIVKDREGTIEVFTATELVEILNYAGEQLIPFFTLGAFAGIRHAEIQRLDWKDIRFDDGIIELHASKAKTASRRIVPILDNLRCGRI